jgi:tetratricopeptide (TPR) repeat protein/ribosomal protein S14
MYGVPNAAPLGGAALDGAIRHLVRHIADPSELRKNPLVAERLAGARPDEQQAFMLQLRAMIRAALPEGSRAARIVQRCDIEGASHKAVVHELGISRRQFYRERARARELIVEAIRAQPNVTVGKTRRETYLEEIETLHELVNQGRTAEALAYGDVLLERGAPAEICASLHAARASAYSEHGEPERAQAEYALGERKAAGGSGAAAELVFARAYAEYVRAAYARAIELALRAVELSVPPPGAPDWQRRAHARHLRFLGNLLQEDHDPRQALAVFGRALDALFACTAVPKTAELRVATDIAMTKLSFAELQSQAFSEATQAHAAASWHALGYERVWALLAMGFAAASAASCENALRYANEAASLAPAVVAGSWLGRILLIVSRVQTACARPHDALDSIAQARVAIPERHHLLRWACDLREGEAHIALQDGRSALAHADAALARFTPAGDSHYFGSLHLVKARALDLLGERRRAIGHCETGLALIRRGGMVRDVTAALRFAARLTGELRFEAEARAMERFAV